jgi:hypothetical protein
MPLLNLNWPFFVQFGFVSIENRYVWHIVFILYLLEKEYLQIYWLNSSHGIIQVILNLTLSLSSERLQLILVTPTNWIKNTRRQLISASCAVLLYQANVKYCLRSYPVRCRFWCRGHIRPLQVRCWSWGVAFFTGGAYFGQIKLWYLPFPYRGPRMKIFTQIIPVWIGKLETRVGIFYQIIVFKIKEKGFKISLNFVELWLHLSYSESGQRFVNYLWGLYRVNNSTMCDGILYQSRKRTKWNKKYFACQTEKYDFAYSPYALNELNLALSQ